MADKKSEIQQQQINKEKYQKVHGLNLIQI